MSMKITQRKYHHVGLLLGLRGGLASAKRRLVPVDDIVVMFCPEKSENYILYGFEHTLQ